MCNKVQEVGQKILVEVPLFEKVENYNIGSMHLEHLHYFAEKNLFELISSAGYEVDFISKIIKSTEFPFITIVATKQKKVKNEKAKNYKLNLENLKKYMKISQLSWRSIKSKIEKLPKNRPMYLYGAGSFTSQLLFYTKINKKKIVAILDSSKIKQKGNIGQFKILSPNIKNLKENSTIIISSATCQESIYDSIKHYENYGHKIVKLFK